MEQLLLLYKPLGLTPLELIKRYREAHPEYKGQKMTYAGRLDPMAEGLVLILTGEACNKKDDYLGLEKTYEATILLGVQSDSLDLLGIVDEHTTETSFNQEKIQKALASIVGTHEWPYPNFSSHPVNGKPLFQWTREGAIDQIEIPKRKMVIKTLSLNSINSITSEDLLSLTNERVALVNGDFRQETILNQWKSVLDESNKIFQTVSIELTVTSGTYIRSAADQLGKILGCGACLLHLKRTVVGPYTTTLNTTLET